MAFPQIGLEAILKIDQFEKNARTYNRTLDSMDKKTKRTSTAINKSTQKAASSAFDLTKGFREAAGGVDATAEAAASGATKITASFGQITAAAGIVTAGIGGTIAALNKLLVAGEEAAALEDMRAAFVALAADSGISASKLIDDLRSITRGTVDTASLIKIANTALLAGGAQLGKDLPRFLETASKAARTTGQDLNFVTETLIKGVVKGSPLLIDNAELYLNIGDAVEEYALSIGKTVDELTRQERTIATGNAVLEQSAEAYSALGESTAAATDPFRQLRVQTDALGTGLKTIAAPAADALAKSLSGLLVPVKAVIAGAAALGAVQISLTKDLSNVATAADTYRETFDRVFQKLTTGINPIEDIEDGIQGIGDAAVESAAKVSELDSKLADLATQRGERLAKIELQNARRDEDITIQRGRQLEDADRQLARTREDQARDAARARGDLERDNAKRLVEIARDTAEKERKFVQEAQRAREDLERDHQESLFQIRQKAQDTIGEAARRNDAVAIAQALRQRQREIRDEQRDSQVEKSNLQRDLQEKRTQLDEDAATEKQKQQQRFAEQLAALQENQARQEESLQLSLTRQTEDRNLAWQRQSADLVRARDRQLEDLDLWYESEQQKLKKNLDEQVKIATQGVQKAGVAIAQATTTAISTVAASTIGLSAEQQFQRRGTYLESEATPSSIGLSEEEQRRLRGSFLRRAEGGVDVVDRPTKFLAGEAGPEVAAFVPLRNTQHSLDISGALSFDNLPGGMTQEQAQGLIWAALEVLAKRIVL